VTGDEWKRGAKSGERGAGSREQEDRGQRTEEQGAGSEEDRGQKKSGK
jgi:hypothetical protein